MATTVTLPANWYSHYASLTQNSGYDAGPFEFDEDTATLYLILSIGISAIKVGEVFKLEIVGV